MAIEERPETIHLVPVAQLVSRQITMVPPDGDLATIKPSNQIVRKIFDVKRYNVTKLADVLKPLLPKGYEARRCTTTAGRTMPG